jgi:hypothetical protein
MYGRLYRITVPYSLRTSWRRSPSQAATTTRRPWSRGCAGPTQAGSWTAAPVPTRTLHRGGRWNAHWPYYALGPDARRRKDSTRPAQAGVSIGRRRVCTRTFAVSDSSYCSSLLCTMKLVYLIPPQKLISTLDCLSQPMTYQANEAQNFKRKLKGFR